MRRIGSSGDEPFFLFLHTYELHHPYTPKPEFLEPFTNGYTGSLPDAISVDPLRQINNGDVELEAGDLNRIIDTYDAELRSVDHAFGRLIDFLRAEGLYDDAVIVLTSDRGEEFGEHGFVGWHSHTLYDELLRVPLLLKLPSSEHAGDTIDSQVRGIDIAPTVLAPAGIEAPESFEGATLLGPLTGAATVPEYAVSRKDVPVADDFASIRARDWKWIRGRLFNLKTDARETSEASKTNESVAATMQSKLDELLAARPTPSPKRGETRQRAPRKTPIPRLHPVATRGARRALGYQLSALRAWCCSAGAPTRPRAAFTSARHHKVGKRIADGGKHDARSAELPHSQDRQWLVA